MLRRFGLFYTVFSLVVLLALAGLLLGRLNTVRSQNIQEVESSFRRLKSDLGRLDSIEAMRAHLREYAALVPAIETLLLFDPDRGLQYVWASDTDVLRIPGGDFSAFRGLPEYDFPEVRQIRLRDDLGREVGGYRLYIDAIYTVLAFPDAYLPLRDCLIALLGFALLTVVLMLVLGSDRRVVREEKSPKQSSPEPAPESRSEPPVEQPARHAPAPETHASPEPDLLHEVPLEEIALDSGEPGSLVNATTGLSYREHLARRLGLELERSAHNDQDLACLLIRFRGIANTEMYVQAAALVLSTFQYEDLCFEFDDQSFCVILPNTELPQAIKQSEAFRRRHPEAIMGLSARNGRLVESKRVLAEAERSLAHAEHEPGGIVGFRPDPRKYRQFVSQNFGERD
jgi:GGDEF domain-containing protein